MADQRESVPGMAEAIERRRLDLGLTKGELAERAEVTRQGLDPVRRGERRDYNDRTIIGVARALRWEVDWYARLCDGREPVEATVERDDDTTADLSSLSAEGRAAVRAIIAEMQTRQR